MKVIFFFIPLLILFNSKAQKLEISQIEFNAGSCYGTCPIFVMNISSDGSSHYEALKYNERQGRFTTVIKQSQLDSLTELITNSDFFNLKNNYSIERTDQATYKLTIILKDGQTKTIVDYGLSGPDKLILVYKRIFSFRKTQDWK